MVTTAAESPTTVTISDIKKEYSLWAKHLNLSTDPLKRLNQGSEEMTFYRRSCCLHYRRKDGAPCNNCPRLHKAKKVRHV